MKLKGCFEKKLLKRIEPQRDLFEKEVEEAKRDLERSKHTFKVDEDFKWAIIKAYYSMFHAAKSILYLIGLKEKSHECVAVVLEELSKKGLLESYLVEEFRSCKEWRENADYRYEYSKEVAENSISMAKRFLKETEKISRKIKPEEI